MEKWDAYTKEGKRTGDVLIRSESIPAGLYHLVCEVLVRHEDGSYLCMKRANTKPNYPGYYEATAGGAALMGEDKIQCIQRELKEETGIVCNEFEEVGYYVSEEDQSICYSFVCCVDCDKGSVELQDGETEDYKWMTEEEFVWCQNSGEMIESQKKRYFGYFMTKGYII